MKAPEDYGICRWQAASPGVAGAGATGSPPKRNDSDTPEMPAPEKSITWLEPTHSALPFLTDAAADNDDEEATAAARSRISFAGVGSEGLHAREGAGAAYPASPHPLRGSASPVEARQRSSLRGSRQSSLAGSRQPSLGGGGGDADADGAEEEPRKVSFAGLRRGDLPRTRY